SAQDMSIFQLIIRNGKGCVIAVNKWDLVEKETNTLKEYEKNIRARIAPFTDVPVIFTSVVKKQRIMQVLEAAAKVFANRTQRIPTSRLNETLLPEIEAFPPPAVKGKYVKIKYVTQLPTPCPSFAFFCNLPQYVREDYKRFLENKLRMHFDLNGTPVQIFMRQK
ncbi:MAG TPA: ribosome biogenesis GTPase Der, partial [Bacteroidales bacterium]|nr:ribosome biogenesis GTPase Der [Bacteroidales bacterium]